MLDTTQHLLSRRLGRFANFGILRRLTACAVALPATLVLDEAALMSKRDTPCWAVAGRVCVSLCALGQRVCGSRNEYGDMLLAPQATLVRPKRMQEKITQALQHLSALSAFRLWQHGQSRSAWGPLGRLGVLGQHDAACGWRASMAPWPALLCTRLAA